jgi:thymidylate synthase (FAD)
MTEFKLLDHGYLKLVESWGTDERIIEAARMSTGGGFVSWEPYDGHPKGDAGLLEFLWTKKHATPFEMCGLVFEVHAPISVYREWHRHRTQSYNEASARYAPLPSLDYVPTVDRCMIAAEKNKQAAAMEGADELTADAAYRWLRDLEELFNHSQRVYSSGLNCGIPKEIARGALTVHRYSKMRVSANLRNWLAFLTLRMDTNAQWEIRQYANAIGEVIAQTFPRTWSLFKKP